MSLRIIYCVVFYFATAVLAAPSNDRKVNTCGCAKPLGSNRIVGGKEVSKATKYPYQIWVQGKGACGGSIINKRYILSAAHCFGKAGETNIKVNENNYVMLGSHDMMGMDSQFLMIEKIIMHPKYNTELGNDVAIIKVSSDIVFSDKVRPVCLATDKNKDYTGQLATVTGWGGTKGYNPGQKAPEQPAQYIRVLQHLHLGLLHDVLCWLLWCLLSRVVALGASPPSDCGHLASVVLLLVLCQAHWLN